jgi:UDP-N-acetylglucosamine 3-dehydrogenase
MGPPCRSEMTAKAEDQLANKPIPLAPARAAVVGVGAIGKHHARVYSQLDTVELVAVADVDESRRAIAARRYKIPTYSNYHEMFEREHPGLVSVAVPTGYHREVALAAIGRGINVLVEKPLCSTVEEAREVITAAEAAGVVLTTGHIERFNGAIAELKPRILQGEIGKLFQVQGRRLSPFPGYIRDVGVVMDLATHELDMMQHLVESPVERMYAEVARNVHEQHEDMLTGIIRFRNGVVGVLDINWLTPTKLRELRVTGERGMFLVDYIAQDLFFYENRIAPSQWEAMALFRGVEEGNMLKIRVSKVEPLEAELRAFVETVTRGAPPRVTGLDGLRAVALARLLLLSAQEKRVVNVAEEADRLGWLEVVQA